MGGTLKRLVLVLLALGIAACGAPEPPNPSPAVVPGAPVERLRIGIPVDEPGIGVREGDTYSGFDVETARYVARALGVPDDAITWVESTGDDRERMLVADEVDMIVSTFSITEERRQAVEFAGPYFVAHQDLLVRRNEEEIRGPERLDGRTLCTVAGTTSADNVRQRYQGRITLREFGRYSECVAALARSEVDAVTTDDVILAGYAAQPQYQGQLRVIGVGFSDESYGIGVRKGDTALVERINAALRQYVEDGSWRRALDLTVAPSGYAIPDPPEIG